MLLAATVTLALTLAPNPLHPRNNTTLAPEFTNADADALVQQVTVIPDPDTDPDPGPRPPPLFPSPSPHIFASYQPIPCRCIRCTTSSTIPRMQRS